MQKGEEIMKKMPSVQGDAKAPVEQNTKPAIQTIQELFSKNPFTVTFEENTPREALISQLEDSKIRPDSFFYMLKLMDLSNKKDVGCLKLAGAVNYPES